jgi:ribulose-5-phosphate 4-epimerase/fuculose-1-phosphate aldolase
MNVASSPASRHGWSQEEWQIRCDLAALYRLCAYHRWTDSIFTHISARVPGPEHHFLLNRFGVMHHEIRASDLVKIDVDGNPAEETPDWDGTGQLVNKAGFVIHSAVHMAREDAHFVIHTHTQAGIAVSAQKHGLLPISQHAMRFHGHLAYHGYEGIALDQDERVRLVQDLGAENALILRNHGLLVCGETAADAYDEIYLLERACAAQIAALSGGAELVLPPEEVCRHTASQYRTPMIRQSRHTQWASALRLIEGDRPDYRS